MLLTVLPVLRTDDPMATCTCELPGLHPSSAAVPGAFATHPATCPVNRFTTQIGSSSRDWRCRPVRLDIVADPNAASPSMPAYHSLTEAFRTLLRLQDVLFKEERTAYHNASGLGYATEPAPREAKYWLQAVNSSAIYQKSLCDILDHQTLPLDALLNATRCSLLHRTQKLVDENNRLREGLSPAELNEMERLVNMRLAGESPSSVAGLGGGNPDLPLPPRSSPASPQPPSRYEKAIAD